jgi:hypothetical protein
MTLYEGQHTDLSTFGAGQWFLSICVSVGVSVYLRILVYMEQPYNQGYI